MTSWSNGSAPRGAGHWPNLVAERRAALAVWAKHETPPALGPVPEVIDDPAIVMLWGITRENLDAWLSADSGADSNEIKGFAASSGVVEGPARIVKSVEEISRLQQGDNPGLSDHEPNLGAHLSDNRRRGLRHRRLDEPRCHRSARVRFAGGGGDR